MHSTGFCFVGVFWELAGFAGVHGGAGTGAGRVAAATLALEPLLQ